MGFGRRAGGISAGPGLTFVRTVSRLRCRKTIMTDRYWQFTRNLPWLDVKAYALVVTDQVNSLSHVAKNSTF